MKIKVLDVILIWAFKKFTCDLNICFEYLTKIINLHAANSL